MGVFGDPVECRGRGHIDGDNAVQFPTYLPRNPVFHEQHML